MKTSNAVPDGASIEVIKLKTILPCGADFRYSFHRVKVDPAPDAPVPDPFIINGTASFILASEIGNTMYPPGTENQVSFNYNGPGNPDFHQSPSISINANCDPGKLPLLLFTEMLTEIKQLFAKE